MTVATISRTAHDHFLQDVITGLSRPQKRLPSKYFYDHAGSKMFDLITELIEYYPTRTELNIMRAHSESMASQCGPHCLLIELGAGSLQKVRYLLDYIEQPSGYVPVDLSGSHLQEASEALATDYPSLPVYPVVADFLRTFEIPAVESARRVVYFPGSTIGNFDPPEADRLLHRIARMVGSGGGLLLGVDLRKDPSILVPAYNDAQGVTAAFNKNLLMRINCELDGEFDLEAFRHFAFYNRERSRIEMHLVSKIDQTIRVADGIFSFRAGESIHTENSYKYDLDDLTRRAAKCGLMMDRAWTDQNKYFAILYFTAVG